MSAGKEFVLLAAVFYQRRPDGSRKRYRTGDVITGLSDDKVARLLKIGAIASESEVAAAVVDDSPVAGGDDAGEESSVAKPAKNAAKAVLVAWLVDNAIKGDGSEYTADELGALKVTELRALIDAVED